jgi:hypothetical protein
MMFSAERMWPYPNQGLASTNEQHSLLLQVHFLEQDVFTKLSSTVAEILHIEKVDKEHFSGRGREGEEDEDPIQPIVIKKFYKHGPSSILLFSIPQSKHYNGTTKK